MLTSTPAVLLRVCDSSSGSHSTPLAAPSEGSSACVVKCVPLRVLVSCTSVYTSACDAGAGVPGPLPEAQRRGNEGGVVPSESMFIVVYCGWPVTTRGRCFGARDAMQLPRGRLVWNESSYRMHGPSN